MLLKLIRISPPSPTKSCVLDLCSYSCGNKLCYLLQQIARCFHCYSYCLIVFITTPNGHFLNAPILWQALLNMFLFSYHTSIIHNVVLRYDFSLNFTSKRLKEKGITTIIYIKLQCSQGWFQHRREICRVISCCIMKGEDEESPTLIQVFKCNILLNSRNLIFNNNIKNLQKKSIFFQFVSSPCQVMLRIILEACLCRTVLKRPIQPLFKGSTPCSFTSA